MSNASPEDDSQNRIVAVTLDEDSIGRSGPDIEHERAIAIYDRVEKNLFAPEGAESGPFTLHLGITGNRLMFDIRREDGTPVVAHLLSLTPFRRIVKDYFMICDSYYQAIRTATPDRIEAIDMGRRGIHDEGSRTLSLSVRSGAETTTFGLHWLSAPEWLRLLERARFQVEALHGWFDLRPYDGEEDMIFIARKAGNPSKTG